jgi:hypothetical protein
MYEVKRFSVLCGTSKMHLKQPVLTIPILKKKNKELVSIKPVLHSNDMNALSSKTQDELALELREHLLIAGLPVKNVGDVLADKLSTH